jgi:acetylcholinesterase
MPVYVWIQGGGMNTQQPNANGTTFVVNSNHDIVFVSFNYRVGPFGFLTSKEVQADGDLNLGILDQRKVLQWVQEHISKVSSKQARV